MTQPLERSRLLSEPELPDVAGLLAEGRRLGALVSAPCNAFLRHYGVSSEAEYKRQCMADGRIMFHAQVGFRDAARTRDGCARLYEALDRRGMHLDRFGITFDRSMGYQAAVRDEMPQGTGLVLRGIEEWQALTDAAPVAPHFADHVLGMPAALENVVAALEAGGTIIGNLAHFFSYRLLYHDDDVQRAAATVTAIALLAAQSHEVLVTSNIDDGFGSLFVDHACSLGMAMIEQHLVEDLLGARAVTVFGNTFANPYNRMVFQRALGKITRNPGPMVYGATTLYGPDHTANQAALAHYLTFDIAAQALWPSGHAVTAVPITEYERIPDTDEIIEVQIIANELAAIGGPALPLIDAETIDREADRLVEAAGRFRTNAFAGLTEAGVDVANPVELLLSLRRLGARELEQRFGPGEPDEERINGHRPTLVSENMLNLESASRACLDALEPEVAAMLAKRKPIACIATTDVHEYAKIVLEGVIGELGLTLVDGGTSADPDDVARCASANGADFIALSTYNGIALSYLRQLVNALDALEVDIPVFVGGRINQVPENSNSSLPADVTFKVEALGVRVCDDVGSMLRQLAADRAPRRRAAS